MRCDQARDMLYDEAGRLRSALLWLHLRRCQACRAQSTQVSMLDDALAALPHFIPPAELLAKMLGQIPQPDDTAAKRKERIRMRRTAYASLAMVLTAIVIALVVAGVPNRPNADSILLGAAHAAETAKSLHLVARGPAPVGIAQGPSAGELHAEAWLASRAVASRYLTPDGTLLRAEVANPDAQRWWYYDGQRRTRYVADLGSVATRAEEVITKASQMVRRTFLSERIMEVLGEGLRDAKKSVAMAGRAGHRVTIISVAHEGPKALPEGPIQRSVFEVDADTKRLLTMRQYVRDKSGREKLLGTVEVVEYDAPFPSAPEALGIPQDAKEVRATPTIEEIKDMLFLVMRAEGLPGHRIGVPSRAPIRQRTHRPTAGEREDEARCLDNLHRLAVAMLVYAREHGGRFPQAKGWGDAISEYVKTGAAFHCPADKAKRSYAMNANLDGKIVSSILSPERTVLVFESNAAQQNAHDTGQSWPAPPRHARGNWVAFADGHAELMKQKPEFRILPTAGGPAR